jgi:hypothetical protein
MTGREAERQKGGKEGKTVGKRKSITSEPAKRREESSRPAKDRSRLNSNSYLLFIA